jgi:DNA-binding NarL/FixJ family response regulator
MSTNQALGGLGVLVVEDEPLVAMELADELEDVGARVIGPAATVEGALALVGAHGVDAAVLDIKLKSDLVYPVADVLAGRGVPFIFATGYDSGDLPASYAQVPTYQKPASAAAVLGLLANSVLSSGRLR